MKKNRWKENAYFPFVVLFVICLTLRMFATVNFHDDTVFSRIPQDQILERLRWNYYNWSTRLVIEFVYYNLYHLPMSTMIWRILDSLVMVLAAYSLGRILIRNMSRHKMTLVCAVVLLYPMLQMSNAGWVSTSANYTWPLALGLYAMTSLRHVYDDEKIKWWQHILYILALIYACNAEQTVCILLGFYMVMMIYTVVKKRRLPIFMIVHFVLETAMFLFKVTGPSNEIVNSTISMTYYPDYYAVSLIEKVTNTFAYTCSHFVKYLNPVFLLMLILICILVFIKYETPLYRYLAAGPLVLCLAVGIMPMFENSLFYAFGEFTNGEINISNFNHFAEYVPLICYMLIGADLLILFYVLWGVSEKTVLAQLMLVAAIASRMILAFSASIYASSTRTYAPMYFCLMALIVFLWQELEETSSFSCKNMTGLKQKVYSGIMITAFLSVCNVLISL